MSKLELKHLAPYLPYELQIGWLSEKEEGVFNTDSVVKMEMTADNIIYFSNNNNNTKPLFMPLSAFNNSEADTEIFNRAGAYTSVILNDISILPYFEVEILFKYHFDVFGLIEKGLAISMIDYTRKEDAYSKDILIKKVV